MGSTAVIVVAAGNSRRFGGERPKVLVPWRSRPLLAWTLATLEQAESVEHVVLVGSRPVLEAWKSGELGRDFSKLGAVVEGGATRQASVRAGTRALPEEVDVVLVHDGARPFASASLFASVALAAARSGAALPLLPVVDTLKSALRQGESLHVGATIPREGIYRAQTPQGVRRDVLLAALRHAEARGLDLTDDVGLVEAAIADGALPADLTIEGVAGEESNVKVTRPEDLPRQMAETRVGLGHDIHPLVAGRRFILAGIDLNPGLSDADCVGPRGHSDGDALTHAACDALLGAAGLGDIGQHYSDTAAENAHRPSLQFLEGVVTLLAAEGWRVGNLSAVVRLEGPKLNPHAGAIRASLASVLRVDPSCVGLSAKRGEGLGPVGEGRALVADAVALIERLA